VREVLHARFEEHAYPPHTHDTWTVLLIDDGAVDYSLDRSPHRAAPASVTLLPPHVPHDGRSAERGRFFRKRVLYLAPEWLPPESVGAAVRNPSTASSTVLRTLHQIHRTVLTPSSALEAEGAVWMLGDHVRAAFGSTPPTTSDNPLARRLRSLLDDHLTDSLTIEGAAVSLRTHPAHLTRAFSLAYGISPHRYLVGRRIDLARQLLLAGHSAASAAARSGFHDQSHLTRHFKRTLGTTPGAFAASGTRA